MSSVTITHTAKDVVSYVQRQFGDESGTQITDSDILRWIDVAQMEIMRQNAPVEKVTSADLIKDQQDYTFTNDILMIKSVRANGRRVEGRSFQEAEEYVISQDPDGTASGQPSIYYQFGGVYTFWPKPSTTAVNGLKLFYVPAPVAVKAVGDKLSIPDTYYPRLLEHVTAQAMELDDNIDAASVKRNQFENSMNDQSFTSVDNRSTYPVITVLEDDM